MKDVYYATDEYNQDLLSRLESNVKDDRNDLDLLNGSLWDKALLFALPLAATGILQQLFNAADIAVVGRLVGKTAMAAVGSNSPVIGLLINLLVGISLGSNVAIANAIGAGDRETARKTAHTSLVIAFVGGVIAAVLGELLAAPVLTLMQVPESVYPMALLYLRVYLLGLPVVLLYNFESSIFRAQGVNVLHSCRFAVGKARQHDFLRVSLSSVNSLGRLGEGLHLLKPPLKKL